MEEANYPSPSKDYKVLVRTITYNQSNYISDTLEGVAMQQTDFPFVHFIIDDASTDGEQNLIKGWLTEHCDMTNAEYIDHPMISIILVKHKSNPNCSYAIYFLKQNLYKNREEKDKIYQPWREHCQYEAMCEGDDYWTDPLKLQKQVDVLDANQDLSLCFHSYKIDYTDGNSEIKKHYDRSISYISVYDLIKGNVFPKVVTIMFVIEKYGAGYYSWCKGSPVGDFPLCLHLYLQGGAAYINEPMSAYRLNAGNSWTSAINKSFKTRYNHRKALNNVWRQFDKVSNYQYTKIIDKGIRKRNMIFVANIIKLFLNKITFGLVLKIEPAIRRFFKI